MSSSLSVVVLFSDISRALYRVLVSTFPEINLLFGRGTSQAQQHQISVANNRWQSCKMNKGGAPSGQRAATQKRLRDQEEEKNPDAKTQREEDDKERSSFFSVVTQHISHCPTSRSRCLVNRAQHQSSQQRQPLCRTHFWHLNILPKSQTNA